MKGKLKESEEYGAGLKKLLDAANLEVSEKSLRVDAAQRELQALETSLQDARRVSGARMSGACRALRTAPVGDTS